MIGAVLQVDCADGCKFTALHSAASGGHVEAIRKLIALGHTVDVLDYVGELLQHIELLLTPVCYKGQELSA